MSSTPNGSGIVVSRPPAATSARVMRIVACRWEPAPSLPRTGAAIAPLNSVTVSVHWAASRGTRMPRATEVISGAPTPPITAPRNATVTMAAPSRRGPELPAGAALIGSSSW
jgi:hypothetical protein